MSPAASTTSGPARSDAALATLVAVVVPAAGFGLLLAEPSLDVRWEHHPSHLWLVLAAAAATAVLAYTTGESAVRRGDARLLWVSLSFFAAGGFLGLHALATPGVFLEASNLGFQVAVPVGLVVAAVLAAISALPEGPALERATPARALWLRGALIALMVGWAAATVAGIAPLDRITKVERASGPIAIPAILGAALFLFAALRYLALARGRRALLPLAVAAGFVLLAEAIIATAFARSWHASWWEWHVLILAAFAIVAAAARREWREERFAALYTEETRRGSREVSVLFADLAGFTRYSEQHDPLAVTEMLNAYFEAAIPPIVREHGGEVDSLIGDAVMATFMSPPDEPDHALRAARAALALRDRTTALADEHPDWPRFRIGVNTGEAMVGVVGAGGGRSYTVIGDAVNVAARLESAAPVGAIAIGAETARRLPGSQLSPMGALEVKGRREPLDAFVLLGLDDA
jgi:class 3 adenylate cyclase